MGLYPIDCPTCKKPHLWFSGNLDTRCGDCVKAETFMPCGHHPCLLGECKSCDHHCCGGKKK